MRERMQNSGCGPMSLATAMVILVVACGISEVGITGMSKDEEQEGIGSPFRKVCCVSGFEYPSGYDWSSGAETDEVKCSLVVFADGVPKIKVPAGDGYEVSRDPDMHRIVNGNLYTFHSKDGRTVIRRNGAPLFRYDADEVPVDMVVKDEDVYILARNRSGGGFSFRKNGKVQLERLAGETFGKLWEDGDSLCFAFTQPVALNDRLEYRHYVVFDSEAVRVQETEEFERVWDIMTDGGSPCVLGALSGTGDTYMIRDGSRRWIEIPPQAQTVSCRLFQADGMMGVESMYTYPDGRCEGGIWVEGSEYMRFETGCAIQALRYADGKAYCILNPEDDAGIIFDAGKIFRMPEGYFCTDDRSLAVHDGELHVVMSSRNGENPLIWHGGQTDTLRFNGQATSITFTEMQTD